MNKRFWALTTLMLALLFAFTGCSYAANKDYYSDVDDYKEIWSLTGFNHGYDGVSLFFPESLENLDVKKFHCRYDEQLPLGEGVQILLEIQYSDEALFDAEIEKISSMATECKESFGQLELSAYATRLGADLSSEYALIDEEQQIIYYVYLQNVPKEEIEFDHELIPVGYTGYGEIK